MAQRGRLKSKLSDRNPELQCRNKCGFYGNPAWHGYCSLCYKSFLSSQNFNPTNAQPKTHVGRVTAATFGTDVASPNEETTLKFAKFEEKKKLQSSSKKQTVKKLFAKTPKLGSMKLPQDQLTWLPKREVDDDFNYFLKSLNKPAAQDIVGKCKYVTSQIMNNPSWTVEQQTDFLQNFYVHMEERLENHIVFRDTTPAQLQTALNGVEKYVMTKIYKVVFAPATTDDELKDLELQKKIRQLKWVTKQHLDAAIDLTNKEVLRLLEDAQNDILEVDTKRAPQDKLACIVRCSKRVFHIIRLSSSDGSPGSADDFLPCLIYIILKSSPTMLNSNIQYISRYCNANKLISGEAGYYFTNLCCAARFIEMIDAKSLSLTEEEFNRYMHGNLSDSPELQAPDGEEVTCEGLQLMQKNLESLSELRERQLRWRHNALKLQQEIMEFRSDVVKEGDSIMNGTSEGKLKYLGRYLGAEMENAVQSEVYSDEMQASSAACEGNI